MSKATTITGAAVLIVVVGFCAACIGARYLVSRLDGTGGVSAPQAHLLQYSSEEGYSFMYPDTYDLSSHTETSGAAQWDVLVLVPKGYVAPQGGEGPPSISVASYNNAEGLPLEQFITNEPKANFGLSGDKKLTPISVGGKPAFGYTYSGLYENDAVAVANSGRVYVFAAGWMQAGDPIRQDLQDIIKSVQFTYAR